MFTGNAWKNNVSSRKQRGGYKYMDNGNFIESADKMAKELAKISKSVNIDEEDMLDFIE